MQVRFFPHSFARRAKVDLMKPSGALGTFLRYWRSEWTGLSRAQLALAVAAQCRRKRVTAAMVREWEEGQPPADTEELNGLLTVMRRHGLSEPEIGHVRRAIFAACLDRHYPELFSAEDFAEQHDVDEEAQRSHGHWPKPASAFDLVVLISRLESLSRTVGRDLEPARASSQRRRQQVALALTLETVRWYCELTGRNAFAMRYAAADVRLLEDCFGLGRVYMAARAPWVRCELLNHQWRQDPSDALVLEQLALSRAAEERGDRELAGGAFTDAFLLASRELRATLWPEAERHVGSCLSAGSRVFEAAVRDGRWDVAEAIVPLLRPDARDLERAVWHEIMGGFAFYRGDLNEAEEHFRACLEISQRVDVGPKVVAMPLWLRACDEARKLRRPDPARLEAQLQREVRRLSGLSLAPAVD